MKGLGKQNKLVLILATFVTVLLFVFIGLAVNYYTSSKVPKEESPKEIIAEQKEEVQIEEKKKQLMVMFML